MLLVISFFDSFVTGLEQVQVATRVAIGSLTPTVSAVSLFSLSLLSLSLSASLSFYFLCFLFPPCSDFLTIRLCTLHSIRKFSRLDPYERSSHDRFGHSGVLCFSARKETELP